MGVFLLYNFPYYNILLAGRVFLGKYQKCDIFPLHNRDNPPLAGSL
jgi:hypothetical protein